MRSIFISYTREDQQAARLIADHLSHVGLSVFFDFEGIVAGDSWSDRIGSALRSADAVVVLLSSNSRRSTYVQDELQTALDSKKLVVPVLLDEGATQNWLWPLVATRRAVKLHLASGEVDKQLHELTELLSAPTTPDLPTLSRPSGAPMRSSPERLWPIIVVAILSAFIGALVMWVLR